jgi:DNA (cytosine-5)-methyltransferase 3A
MKNVLSVFDGCSMFQQALKSSGIKYGNYYASEINESAMSITMKNFPKTIQLGDIRNVNPNKLEDIEIMVAGFPCQQFSIAGNKKGMVDKNGNELLSFKQYLEADKKGLIDPNSQSYLFWEAIRLFKKVKPKYFIFENVARMAPKWKHIISVELGVTPIEINSSLVSAQNRARLYWTNIPGISIPKDKGIHLSSIIPNAIGGFGKRGTDKGKRYPNGKTKWEQNGTTRTDGKANCITTGKGSCSKVELKDGTIRQITIEEAEKLQNLPKNYTKAPGVSETARWHATGNGFTVNVVKHLLKGLKK